MYSLQGIYRLLGLLRRLADHRNLRAYGRRFGRGRVVRPFDVRPPTRRRSARSGHRQRSEHRPLLMQVRHSTRVGRAGAGSPTREQWDFAPGGCVRLVGVTSTYLQGIGVAGVIDTVHARRLLMIPVSAGLGLWAESTSGMRAFPVSRCWIGGGAAGLVEPVVVAGPVGLMTCGSFRGRGDCCRSLFLGCFPGAKGSGRR
jgi:hypothetical protein